MIRICKIMNWYEEPLFTDKYRILTEDFERMIEKSTLQVEADTEYI